MKIWFKMIHDDMLNTLCDSECFCCMLVRNVLKIARITKFDAIRC